MGGLLGLSIGKILPSFQIEILREMQHRMNLITQNGPIVSFNNYCDSTD